VDRWTRFVIRNRKKVLVAWLAALVLAGYASSGLTDLLTNRFSVPGSDAERGLDLLKDEFGERGDGGFTLVVEPRGAGTIEPALMRSAQAAADRAAKAVKGGKAGVVRPADDRILYVPINSVLENADASNRTDEMRDAIGEIPGARAYLTGAPAINHDTEPLYEEDLVKGETIAIPIALLVLAFMLGTLGAIAVPLAFAFVSIPVTLGFVWIFANFIDMATYVQNIVTLIGLAIAIDYSMLVVFRYREELAAGGDAHNALARTMQTAGRATLFSGMTVALGLALLVLMPVPFMQSMGIGGVLVPLVSIAAAATFLPALLAVMGRRVDRFRVVPKRVLEKRVNATGGLWGRLARSIMSRPVPYLLCGGLLMLALAYPATDLQLTAGDNRGVPKTTEATKGLALLEDTLGAGSLAPHQIVVDTGTRDGAWTGASVEAQRALAASLRSDAQIDPQTVVSAADFVDRGGRPAPEVVAQARKASLVSADGRYVQIRAAGIQDSGSEASMDLVDRIRETYVPDAGFRAAEIVVTGAPAFGVDFIDTAYSAFPWLIVGVLILSYLLLLRAFRSLFLPLKAVFMNVLSVSATYGVLVLAFQHGWGADFGLGESPQIEAWIPIFLFAMLFGLSMDYEVFLLSRMREEWDRFRDNEKAVELGLEHTGRIITAAALIMIAAFAGFTAGSFVGLQMFGLGLSVAILLDATIVRALLVPAVMKLMGSWNWYLPPAVARLMRVRQPEAAPAAPAAGPPLPVGNGNLGMTDVEPAPEMIHRMEGRQ
jgi:RND superfamily putative drug exporter